MPATSSVDICQLTNYQKQKDAVQ